MFFQGFGDSKIIPNLPVEQFEAIVKASAAFAADRASVEAIWAAVKGPIYTLTDRQKQLGLGCKGVSTYFSDNCDQEDSDKINRLVNTVQTLDLQVMLRYDRMIHCDVRTDGEGEFVPLIADHGNVKLRDSFKGKGVGSWCHL